MVIYMTKKKFKLDIILTLFIFIFSVISIISIKSANTYLPSYLGNLSIKQLTYYIISIILIFIIIKLKNKNIFKLINILYIIGIISLILLLVIGESVNGSKCWLFIPVIGSVQPSEFMKYILIIKLSIDISNFFKDKKTIKEEFIFLIKELIIILIPVILTFLEPDTGSVIMYLISSLMIFFVSPFRKRWIIIISVLSISFISIFTYLYFYNQTLFINLLGNDMFYRIERVKNFLVMNSGMQLDNAIISVGSSGIMGHGFNKTPLYFPESGTDFIFSVFTSNFGLVGSLTLITIISLFDLYLIRVILKSKNITNKLIITGTISCLIYGQIQNISMTLGILPITGITLPFISYGGSSLISNMIMIGIILNIINENRYST